MPARVAALHPLSAIEGGRIIIEGSGFSLDPYPPDVRIGDVPARIAFASTSRLIITVPAGVRSGPAPVTVGGTHGETPLVSIAAPFATGLHQVDNPVFDDEGNLYLTYSGTRGQQVPVSIFRVRANGTRETFSSGIVNPTSMAIGPDRRLYVSSRFEGTVYRIEADGTAEPFATDLCVACGLAFAPDGTLYVGDRSGTIFRIDPGGKAVTFATLPASVAAFHVAIGPDRSLYVTAPTLSSYDVLYRITPDGEVIHQYSGFGRPQGVAFDHTGTLHVIEALAGVSGLYRVPVKAEPTLVLAGPGLVGVAFDGHGGVAVTSNDTAYRLPQMPSAA